MSNMAIMCRCVEISLLGCVEQNVVQNVPSLTRFLPKGQKADRTNIRLGGHSAPILDKKEK